MDALNNFLTLSETAKALRISLRHFQTLLSNGEGPPVIAIGRRRIIQQAALDRWLEAREMRGGRA